MEQLKLADVFSCLTALPTSAKIVLVNDAGEFLCMFIKVSTEHLMFNWRTGEHTFKVKCVFWDLTNH